MIDPTAYVDATTVVDKDVAIGARTKIWHFCHIMTDSQIGPDCVIGQNVMVAPHVVLGRRVKVQNNVSLYTGVSCEDNVFIGPSVVFTNVLTPRAFMERKDQFLPTLVQHGASIGANATILCGVKIGKFALIGAGAVVTRDVPDYALVLGNPARQQGWVSASGKNLRLTLDGAAYCSECEETYQLIDNVLICVSDD